jgi:hypothetical protein
MAGVSPHFRAASAFLPGKDFRVQCWANRFSQIGLAGISAATGQSLATLAALALARRAAIRTTPPGLGIPGGSFWGSCSPGSCLRFASEPESWGAGPG